MGRNCRRQRICLYRLNALSTAKRSGFNIKVPWDTGNIVVGVDGVDYDLALYIAGKGFPGGEYAASKVITTAEKDALVQFGALMTNGQEELASLAYLITMEFVRENGKNISAAGEKIQNALQALAAQQPDRIACFEGLGHMGALQFYSVDAAKQVVQAVNAECVDVSAQLYKANCPPAMLIKLPLVTSEIVLHVIIEKINNALKRH